MALQLMQGIVVLMPRYLDYENNRTPSFEQYLILKDKVFSKNNNNYWIDPYSPEIQDRQLGLFFHSFTGDSHDNTSH